MFSCKPTKNQRARIIMRSQYLGQNCFYKPLPPEMNIPNKELVM